MKAMLCSLLYEDESHTVATILAAPVCGEDFCQACDACLACAPDDDACPWTESGEHDFVRETARPRPRLI